MADAREPSLPIRTGRLLLRPFDPAVDVDAFHAYRSLPEVCTFAPIEPISRQETAERLSSPVFQRRRLDGDGEALLLAVELVATGELVGDVMLMCRSAEHQQGEIGYVIAPSFQGQGYATEAAQAILGLAFEDLGMHRVSARIDERHVASLTVARRLGLRLEARTRECQWLKGEWITLTEWAMLHSEWNTYAGPS